MTWKRTLLENFVRPLFARVGTIAATYLLTLGFSEGQVNELLAALSAFVLVAIDLAFARYYRKAAIVAHTQEGD